MSVSLILDLLKEHQNPSVIKRYEKAGESQAYIGVLIGTINKLGKQFANQPDLALPLWQTGILDAQLVAIQIMSDKTLTEKDIDSLLDSQLSLQVLDKLTDRVLSHYPDKLALKERLLSSGDLVYQRLGWRLEIARASRRELTDSDIEYLIKTISSHLKSSPEVIKWVMNQCLVEIAVRYPAYREQIIQLTTELGVYREMVVAKGCTSAYAPDWIAARL